MVELKAFMEVLGVAAILTLTGGICISLISWVMIRAYERVSMRRLLDASK